MLPIIRRKISAGRTIAARILVAAGRLLDPVITEEVGVATSINAGPSLRSLANTATIFNTITLGQILAKVSSLAEIVEKLEEKVELGNKRAREEDDEALAEPASKRFCGSPSRAESIASSTPSDVDSLFGEPIMATEAPTTEFAAARQVATEDSANEAPTQGFVAKAPIAFGAPSVLWRQPSVVFGRPTATESAATGQVATEAPTGKTPTPGFVAKAPVAFGAPSVLWGQPSVLFGRSTSIFGAPAVVAQPPLVPAACVAAVVPAIKREHKEEEVEKEAEAPRFGSASGIAGLLEEAEGKGHITLL